MPGGRISRVRRHGGLIAAAATLAVSGAVAGVGVAGAAEEQADATILADDSQVFKPSAVTIAVNETVTWTFNNPGQYHNAVASEDSPTPWEFRSGDPQQNHPTASHKFEAAGTFTFFCEVHPGMQGTVTVTDGGTPTSTPTSSPTSTPTSTATATPTSTATATPTSTATATPTPRPTPQPGGDDHTNTPAPGGGAKDTVKPRISRVSVKALRRAARVRFRLSERATVTIRVKRRGSRKPLRSVNVHAAAGTRTVTLRSKRLKKGRYTVELSARDAGGNRSSLARKSLRLRR